MLKSISPVLRWISGSLIWVVAGSAFLVADSAAITEGFEAGVKPSYAAADVTLSTGVWHMNDALIGGDSADRKTGTNSARIRANGKVSMRFDRTTGAGTVTIQHARYGNDQNTSWQFWCSTNGGSSWTQMGSTVITNSTRLQTASFSPNIEGEVRCEIRKTDGTSNRLNIDDIQISDYSLSPTPSPSPTLTPSPTPSPSPTPVPSPSPTLPPGTLPFFDTRNNPVSGLRYPAGGSADVTPVPPTLDVFDQAVLDVCGAPGKKVSRTEFQTLMNQYPMVLDRIQARMEVASSVPDSTFLNDLTDTWFNAEGFNHVICGEPTIGGRIGGLHFAGRYLELQNKGLAGRLANNAGNEEIVSGAIYTVGVKMIIDGSSSQSTIKGYGYTMSAEDILAIAGYAYTQNPNSSGTSQACNLTVNDDGQRFTAVFVAKTDGIRTFYPDATPSGNPNCTQ
jgi:hypothetical protein